MKKISLFILSVLLPMLSSAATSTLSIEPFTIGAGETKAMLIDLNNPGQQVTMVEFHMQLPQGLTVAAGDDALDIAGRTSWQKHTLYMNEKDGLTHIMLASPTNALVSGTSGALISVKLQASSSFSGGTITLKNQKIGSPDMTVSKPADYSYTVQIPAPQPTEAYAVYNNEALTFYYDNRKNSREGIPFEVQNMNQYPGWYPIWFYPGAIKKVVFDPSFSTFHPTSTYGWFCQFTELTEIVGINYLNTDEVTDMSFMFMHCLKLSSIDLSHFNTSKVTSMKQMFESCELLSNIDVSSFKTSNVNNFERLFGNCPNLNKITLGSSFLSHETANCDNIFNNSPNLKTIAFTGDIPSSINSKFFVGVGTADSPATLDVPEEYRDHYAAKMNGNKFFGGYFTLSGGVNPVDDIISFADPVTKQICVSNWDTDGDGELSKAEAAAVQDLNKVFQKSSITSFDELRYFTGLSTIPQGNFWQCERMESIIIPVNVTKLGDWLFQECHNLSRLEVDENNKNYSSPAGSNAIVDNWNRLLYGCKNTIIPETVTSIYYCAFAFNNGITSIHIPASVNSITSSSFNDCANLNTITVDENNTTYDSRDNCNAIIKTDNNQIIVGANSTTIPKTITSIGSSAFSGRNLASISIPGNIKTIGSFAFTSCQNLKELYLEEGIEVIEEYAFQVCNALQQINIPSTVTSIGRNSFNGYQLRTINSAVTTPFAIENNVFHSNCYQLGTLYVPAGTKALYQQTDGWKQFKNIEETGDVPHPQLEMSVEVQNAVNGVIYEDKAYIKMTSEHTGEGPLDGSIFIKIYKLLDNGETQELGGSKMSAWITGYQSYFYLDGEGKYKADCGYESTTGTQTVLGTTFFECRPDDRYVTIIMEDDMRTYCHEADLDFTDVQGLKAYTAGGFNTATNEALMMRVVDVPAQTGLLLVGAPGAYLAKKGTSSTVYVNMLKGVTKDTTIDRTEGSYFNYVFRDGEEGLGFYLANNNTSVSSHEAYLQLRYGVAGSRPIVKMVFDDMTAISDIPSDGQPFDVYSLSGILLKRGATSLKAMPAGIYIVNGRKVVNK